MASQFRLGDVKFVNMFTRISVEFSEVSVLTWDPTPFLSELQEFLSIRFSRVQNRADVRSATEVRDSCTFCREFSVSVKSVFQKARLVLRSLRLLDHSTRAAASSSQHEAFSQSLTHTHTHTFLQAPTRLWRNDKSADVNHLPLDIQLTRRQLGEGRLG